MIHCTSSTSSPLNLEKEAKNNRATIGSSLFDIRGKKRHRHLLNNLSQIRSLYHGLFRFEIRRDLSTLIHWDQRFSRFSLLLLLFFRLSAASVAASPPPTERSAVVGELSSKSRRWGKTAPRRELEKHREFWDIFPTFPRRQKVSLIASSTLNDQTSFRSQFDSSFAPGILNLNVCYI